MTAHTMSTTATDAVVHLRSHVRGRVVVVGDDEYDELRAIMLGGVDPHPAVVVRPVDDADVAEAVRTAARLDLPLAIRSGGHSGLGHGTVEGGIVIDLRQMKAMDIDPHGRTVWAEAGLTAGEVTAATAEHGLAIGFGDTASVGISGITLGGGVGYLTRKFGLTIDNVLAADVVTADGRVVRTDAEHHPDLFWAIRGGGGNVGVVTRFQFRLHDVPEVVGGMFVLPATAPVLAGLVAAAEAAPEELSAVIDVMPCPPMPFIPAEHHGELVILVLACFAGDAEAGAAAFAPFRALAEPLVDAVRPTTYPAMFPDGDPEGHPIVAATTLFTDAIDEDVAAALIERVGSSDAPMRVVQIRVLGGAVGRVGADATAYAHRSARVMVYVMAVCLDAEDRVARLAWVAELAGLVDHGVPGAYVNFLGDEGPDRSHAAYPGSTWDRLAAVKATYDPANLFRHNHNVAPATVG